MLRAFAVLVLGLATLAVFDRCARARRGRRPGDRDPVAAGRAEPGSTDVTPPTRWSRATGACQCPGAIPVTVIGGGPLLPNRVYHQRSSYIRNTARRRRAAVTRSSPRRSCAARSGRESFSRSWSISSDLGRPTTRRGARRPSHASKTASSRTTEPDNDAPATIRNLFTCRSSCRQRKSVAIETIETIDLRAANKWTNERTPDAVRRPRETGNTASRRITFCVLAAAAVLTAAPAQADPASASENSCRMPDVVELPPAAAAPAIA